MVTAATRTITALVATNTVSTSANVSEIEPRAASTIASSGAPRPSPPSSGTDVPISPRRNAIATTAPTAPKRLFGIERPGSVVSDA